MHSKQSASASGMASNQVETAIKTEETPEVATADIGVEAGNVTIRTSLEKRPEGMAQKTTGAQPPLPSESPRLQMETSPVAEQSNEDVAPPPYINHHVEGYDNFVKYMEKFKDDKRPVFVWFSGSKLPNGKSWCSDCNEGKLQG